MKSRLDRWRVASKKLDKRHEEVLEDPDSDASDIPALLDDVLVIMEEVTVDQAIRELFYDMGDGKIVRVERIGIGDGRRRRVRISEHEIV